ncbi:MAG: hypothetical protein IIZ62_04030 [Ruminococcus sp.]|nr:hypothetical protein [Ruminococcus sp.]
MGFLDKVKDFLDDGKINGSTQQPQQVNYQPPVQPVQASQNQPQQQVQQTQTAMPNTLEVGKTIFGKFGTPYPVAYKEPEGDVSYVRASGSMTLVIKAGGLTEEMLSSTITPMVSEELVKELARCSSNGIRSNQLHTHLREISENMVKNLDLSSVDVQSISFANIVASKER